MPAGEIARDPQECRRVAQRLGRPVVIKAQIWGTGRAQAGAIRFANTPLEAASASQDLFGSTVNGAKVEVVLVEEKLPVEREFYVGMIVDDRLRRPVLLIGTTGGTGIEERARGRPDALARMATSVKNEPSSTAMMSVLAETDVPGELHPSLAEVLLKLYRVSRSAEARVAEINPLALTADGHLVALDCRMSIDDHAVYRHPELGIEVAREFDHPPTTLERIAWLVERDDYRGTFYFVELRREPNEPGIFIGFHGAGGGGSMASLDAALGAGLRPANYTDTSGNPAASKVYRAAKMVLSQSGIRGYFLSGSGVASQEQFHLARALVKAFREEQLSVPAVLRLGGNGEELAAEIIRKYTADLAAPVEAYEKTHSADFCAQRLRQLIDARPEDSATERAFTEQGTERIPEKPYSFETRTGRITYDHAVCLDCDTKACVTECIPQILKVEGGLPVLKISLDEAQRGRCIECLACEVECWFQGKGGASIELPIPGLEAYRASLGREA